MSAADVDAYFEYKKIVGDDDGGKLFTPEEYERYKREILPQRLKNRLFTAWTNTNDMDCKLIGPETMCFCMHRYRQHQTDFKEIPQKRPILLPCREKGCKCVSYEYIPWSGGGPIRCKCKHSGQDHSTGKNHQCLKDKCSCITFTSSYPCMCTQKYSEHRMIVETKDERLQRGKPVGQDVGFQAMGGITGFSSMIDGYARMDASGRGALSEDVLNAEIGENDHPMLRNYAAPIQRMEKMAIEGPSTSSKSLSQSHPATRRGRSGTDNSSSSRKARGKSAEGKSNLKSSQKRHASKK